MIAAITLDFGNTLVPIPAGALRGVVGMTVAAMADRLGPFDRDALGRAWGEERERQFREEVPELREVDLYQRVRRVLARLRGMPVPEPGERWDDESAATRSSEAEVGWAVETYSQAFVTMVRPAPETGELLARLAGRHPLAILSNWPLAATIDRVVEAAGWSPHFRAVVVSQRVGAIKPHPAMFAAASAALGGPDPGTILHVGDDWAADIVGAKRAGWRAAYLHDRPGDSPLPGSERDQSVIPDLELVRLGDLEVSLDRLAAG